MPEGLSNKIEKSSDEEKIKKLEEMGVTVLNNSREISDNYEKVVLGHQMFSCRVEDSPYLRNGNEIGEGYTDMLKNLLDGLNLKDFGFVLKYVGKTVFEVVPMSDDFKQKEFINIYSQEKMPLKIKFYREGRDIFRIELPNNLSSLRLDQNEKDEVLIEKLKILGNSLNEGLLKDKIR